MKILLVYLAIDSPQNKEYSYGLGYIAAVIREGGHEIQYIALRKQKETNYLYEKVKSTRPDIIGFSLLTSQLFYLKSIVKDIKKICRSFLICGGVHPTLNPDCIFDMPELDGIVRGEGEYPFLELVEHLVNNKNYTNIKNFWFKKSDNIYKNDMRPLISDLDQLPFPDKTIMDYQKIIDRARGRNRYIFSRGCPFHCTYCCNKALADATSNGVKYLRFRSPEKAIEEIFDDCEKFQFNSIVFDDDTISINRTYAVK